MSIESGFVSWYEFQIDELVAFLQILLKKMVVRSKKMMNEKLTHYVKWLVQVDPIFSPII